MSEECPYCGAPDFEDVGNGTPRICLSCGFDDEHGALGVCPGGLHPKDGQVCCDACWKRAPRDLPGEPRWRSRRRSARARAYRSTTAWRECEAIDAALLAWLHEHPAEDLRGR